MDSLICWVSPALSRGTRGAGGASLSDASRQRPPLRRIDPKSGLQRNSLFVSRGLEKDFGWLQGVDRAQNRERIPLVLSREEIKAVISRLASTPRLMAELLYCSGLRLMECVWLRVKDIDIPRRQLVVREGRAATIACRCVASVIARSSAIELIWRESKAPQPASELKHANPRLQQKRS